MALIALVYAAMLRGKKDRYHRLALGFGVIMSPLQVIVGDLSARYVAGSQPARLAAMEAVLHTARGVPETIGGLVINGKIVGAIQVPDGLSILTRLNPHAQIQGMNAVPAAQRPPVDIVHPPSCRCGGHSAPRLPPPRSSRRSSWARSPVPSPRAGSRPGCGRPGFLQLPQPDVGAWRGAGDLQLRLPGSRLPHRRCAAVRA